MKHSQVLLFTTCFILLLSSTTAYPEDCLLFEVDLILQNETVAGGQVVIHEAHNTITAGPSYVIENGADVTLRAGRITLRPGFRAQGGSKLTMQTKVDLDNDGLPDWWELAYFNHLCHHGDDDPDGDLVTNLQEYTWGFDPSDADGFMDNDGDGLPNWWELKYFDNFDQNGSDNPDGDELTNSQEYDLGTDPNVYCLDSDEDLLPDLWEWQYFRSLVQGQTDDTDGDGATNHAEYKLDTDPSDSNDRPDSGIYYEYDALGRIKSVVKVQ
jgi:hypothetical protein